MFFQADAINSILICKICDNKMVDPCILPCGKSVCHRCVDLIADTDKKKIMCGNHTMELEKIRVSSQVQVFKTQTRNPTRKTRLFE
jgi:hypothetical protein